ncbi:MAG: nucleotidyltransferase domain-containing protein [Candidatus Marinimicrobia bacterium]|nr:nucleotidyltransferase domain-containing protein [Candidatus Neomarinimicrobiota bacterium]
MTRSDVINILSDFKESSAEKYGIILLGVFGSVARDQMNDQSDVDIVLQTRTPDPYLIVHIKKDLEKRLIHQVDIVRLRDSMNPSLKQRIEQDAIYV